MKGKMKFFMGLSLGAIIVLGIGFLGYPLSFEYFSFLLGMVVCLLLVSTVFVVLLLGNDSKERETEEKKRNHRYVGLLTFALMAIVGLLGSYWLFEQKASSQAQKRYQEENKEQQTALREAVRSNSLGLLMNNIFNKIDEELKDNPQKKLSEATIARIAALSYSFKTYKYLEGDSLSEKAYSPERGQLLLQLSKMAIDSSSFSQIKRQAIFAGAYLKRADLQGADLRGASLREANLQEADLRGANLAKADLWGANMWGVNLERAQLQQANLKRANLGWADLKRADLRRTILNGADMTAAKLSQLDMRGADLKWANLDDAILKEVNLAGVAVTGTTFRKANLKRANLRNTDLKFTDFKWANLSGANLSGANVSSADLSQADLRGANLTDAYLYKITFEEENWMEKLKEWDVKGVDDIREKYKIEIDRSQVSNYWLFPIKK